MNIRKNFICIFLLFLAYFVHAIPVDQFPPEKCESLSSLDFEVTITNAQEELFEIDDWPAIEEEALQFQDNNIFIITIKGESRNRHLCKQFILSPMDFQRILMKSRTGVLEEEDIKRLFRRNEDGELMPIPHNGSRGVNALATAWREADL